MLPGISGFDVCRELRKTVELLVIMLTAKGQDTDKIMGLELGADDYMVKPFNPFELIARIKAMLRRRDRFDPEKAAVYIYGSLRLDTAANKLIRDDEEIELDSH